MLPQQVYPSVSTWLFVVVCAGMFVAVHMATANWNYTIIHVGMVRLEGLEPPRREALEPKSSVSTNFTTSACDLSATEGY